MPANTRYTIQMIEIVKVRLENEMDLILTHKEVLCLAEKLNLTPSTQIAFATAVSELSRELVERTDTCTLAIGLIKEGAKYCLTALFCFEKEVGIELSAGYQKARQLIPRILHGAVEERKAINLRIGFPASLNPDRRKIDGLIRFFQSKSTLSPYEEIKQRTGHLSVPGRQGEEVLRVENDFITTASHELKTPVTVIKAYAQLALASGKDQCSPVVQSYLRRIEAQSAKLSSLIHEQIDVSKIESSRLEYKMEKLNLDKFVKNVASDIQRTIPLHPLSVSLNAPFNVSIDRLRIKLVLSHLLENAAKYSPGNSKIELSTSPGERNFVVISVKDYGIGIPDKNTLKIFEKFYRDAEVLSKYSGLGMGLYISAKIVQEHGGSIWVESKEGEGSTFYFSLPSEKKF